MQFVNPPHEREVGCRHRPGQVIDAPRLMFSATACFVIGNNNAYLEDARLSKDEAWLLIRHPGGRHDARYYLASRISPTFSSARMILPLAPQQASTRD